MRNALKIVITVFLDAALIAGLLLGFAWFHHVKPKSFDTRVISVQTPKPTAEPTEIPVTPAPTELPPDVTPEPTPEPMPEPTPEPAGLLGGKYWDKFTESGVIRDENGYRSPDVCVEMSKREMLAKDRYPVTYYVADIYIRDITSFRTYVSETESRLERVEDMARACDAIVAVSGDYFLFHYGGLAIRNGVLYREKLHSAQEVCVLFRDGTVETFETGHVDLDYIYSRDPWQAWSFGPHLIEDGQPAVEFNTSVFDRNPRCVLGYYEPGHYCMVVVDGRQRGYSVGLDMAELAQLMCDLGCTQAFNLDGGMTSMMAYGGELYSRPCGGGRSNCDILYIGEPEN